MSGLSTDSETGKQLNESIKQRISTFNLDDDLNDVAEYIVMMVCNNKQVADMTSELGSIFGDKFDDAFGQWVYSELERLQKPAAPQSAFDNTGSGQKEVRIESAFADTSNESSGFGGYVDNSSRSVFAPPRGPSNMRRGQMNNGVSKQGGGRGNNNGPRRLGGHAVGGDNLANLENQASQDMMMDKDNSGRGEFNNLELGGGGGGSGGNNNGDGQQRRKERCRHWPHCNYPNCRFPHPTKPCISFPNCTYAKGTCPFLHLGEDPLPGGNGAFVPPNGEIDPSNPLGGGWMNGIPVPPQMSHPQMLKKKKPFKKQHEAPQEPALIVCKFTDKCANAQCLFGHPTPANPNAQVRIMEWCPQDVQCQEPTCEYAHKSGSLVRAPEPIPSQVAQDCKFLERCTNPKCRYRHPRSHIKCRNGPKCERMDCLFLHEKEDQCKFGINCKAPACLFQHPPERDQVLKQGGTSNTWVNTQVLNNSGEDTSERQFASDEAEKMVIES